MERTETKNLFLKYLQALVIMFLVAVGFKAGISETLVSADDDVIVYVDLGLGFEQVTDFSTIDGLSLDINDGDYVLTLNGYNGGAITVENKTSTSINLDVKVVGNNSISAKKEGYHILYFANLDVAFVGSGTLDINMGDSHYFETYKSNIIIDGPTINMLNSDGTLYIEDGNLKMKSGVLNIERVPKINESGENGYDFSYYGCIFSDSFEMSGGNIDIEYVYPKGYNNVQVIYDFGTDTAVIYSKYNPVITGGNIDIVLPEALEGLAHTVLDESIVFSFADKDGNWTNNSFGIPDDIKGLSWDYENKVLTFDGYDGGDIYICQKTGEDNSDIKVVVKGENTLHGWGDDEDVIYGADVNLNFTGDGSLNFVFDNNELNYDDAIYVIGGLVVDGPAIIVNSKERNMDYAALGAESVEIKSGYIYVALKPSNGGFLEGALYSYNNDLIISGGTIVVEYIDADEGVTDLKYYRPTLAVDGDDRGTCVDIDNCVIVFIGSDASINAGKQMGLHGGKADEEEARIKIGDNAIIKYATSFDTLEKIDISSYKASLSETVFKYDGKAKTPKVTVEGLLENVCYTVTYENNIKAGTANAIIKGAGVYTGTIKLSFTIKEDSKETESAKADGPKAGTTIKDKKYVYKVTKAGSKDGSIVGELEVTGLKKKSLTQIKIAAVVKIEGVSYKVVSVGAKAFKGNKKITKATIGKNVVKIGASAFANCKKLKQATINAKGLKSIGKNAFAGDKKLKKIIVKSTKLKKVGKKALKGTSKKIVVKVPKAKKKAYKKLFKKAGNKKVKVK